MLVIAWIAVCAITIVDAIGKLHQGVSSLTAAKSQLHLADLESSTTVGTLHTADSRFDSAHHLLSEPWMAPLDVAPYVGRQLSSARALASAAHTVTAAGTTALVQTQALLKQPHGTPPQRAALLTQLQGVVGPFSTQLDGVKLGPAHALLPTLASRRATFATYLGRLQGDVGRGAAALRAVTSLINGNQTYLVFGANNAEMRSGSGTYLSVGTLTSSGGSLSFGTFKPTGDLAAGRPLVPVTGDMQALWGLDFPSSDYRELARTPQFPANAYLAAQMWQAQTGQKVSGVLVVDIDALRSLLQAVGPVDVGGQSVDAAQVEPLLLEQQYAGLSGNDPAYEARHDQQSALAAAVFQAVEGSGASVASLAQAVASAGSGRHIMAWSADPSVESAWLASGAGGRLAPNGMMLSLINGDANKLDPYQAVSATTHTEPDGPNTRLVVQATFTNQTPPGLSPYAAAGNSRFTPYGGYVGVAMLNFPPPLSASVDNTDIAVKGPDYGSNALGVYIALVPGQSTTVTWTLTYRGSSGGVTITPSARIPSSTWHTPNGTFTDADAHAVNW